MKQSDGRLAKMAPTIAVFIMVLIAFAGAPGDPWYDRLKEWQTLITGVLALIAAVWTVGEMKRSDAAADHRHQQLMRLQLSAKISAIDRLLKPNLKMLRAASKKLSVSTIEFSALVNHRNSGARWNVALGALKSDVQLVLGILQKEEFDTALKYFDGAEHHRYQSALNAFNQLSVALESLPSANFRGASKQAAAIGVKTESDFDWDRFSKTLKSADRMLLTDVRSHLGLLIQELVKIETKFTDNNQF